MKIVVERNFSLNIRTKMSYLGTRDLGRYIGHFTYSVHFNITFKFSLYYCTHEMHVLGITYRGDIDPKGERKRRERKIK